MGDFCLKTARFLSYFRPNRAAIFRQFLHFAPCHFRNFHTRKNTKSTREKAQKTPNLSQKKVQKRTRFLHLFTIILLKNRQSFISNSPLYLPKKALLKAVFVRKFHLKSLLLRQKSRGADAFLLLIFLIRWCSCRSSLG